MLFEAQQLARYTTPVAKRRLKFEGFRPIRIVHPGRDWCKIEGGRWDAARVTQPHTMAITLTAAIPKDTESLQHALPVFIVPLFPPLHNISIESSSQHLTEVIRWLSSTNAPIMRLMHPPMPRSKRPLILTLVVQSLPSLKPLQLRLQLPLLRRRPPVQMFE